MSDKNEEAFEAWWESDGQYSRAGGGSYEKTFAFNAWQAALSRQCQEGYVLVTPEQLEKHTTTAWECPPQSLVVLVSSLKRLHSKNATAPTPVAAPAPAVRMCMTMRRPVAECGCPDCGSSLIDWPVQDVPAPAAQEPMQMHHEPHNRAMWHMNCPGRRFESPMRPLDDQGAWECVVCKQVGYTAPPATEQPDAVPVPHELLTKHMDEIGEYAWETYDEMRALLGKEGV